MRSRPRVAYLEVKNVRLLCKRLRRLENEQGCWRNMLRANIFKKYILVWYGYNFGILYFWSSLMQVINWRKDMLMKGCMNGQTLHVHDFLDYVILRLASSLFQKLSRRDVGL
jgi:hypothetical protein